MLIFELCTDKCLEFAQSELHEVLKSSDPAKLSSLPFKDGISNELKNLVISMISFDAHERPTADEILEQCHQTLQEQEILRCKAIIVDILNAEMSTPLLDLASSDDEHELGSAHLQQDDR